MAFYFLDGVVIQGQLKAPPEGQKGQWRPQVQEAFQGEGQSAGVVARQKRTKVHKIMLDIEFIMGNTFAKAAGIDFGIQWSLWALASLLQTEKVRYILLPCLPKLAMGQNILHETEGHFWYGDGVGGKEGKDSRFNGVRGNPGRFWVYWTIQGLWIFVTLLPVLVLNNKKEDKPLTYRDYAGWGLWTLGFLFESIADYQKSAFKANPDNAGKFITSGLWSTSRYPNYFGEICMWSGLFLTSSSAMTSAKEYASVLSPLFVTFLLLKVSGVPIQEKQQAKRWGTNPDFIKYVKNTAKCEIARSGACNICEIARSGACNICEIARSGACNICEIARSGACNICEIARSGARNICEIARSGARNICEIARSGARNICEIARSGARNICEIARSGARNICEIARSGARNICEIARSGARNICEIARSGARNICEIARSGARNICEIARSGAHLEPKEDIILYDLVQIADMSLPDLESIADMSLPDLEPIADMSLPDLEPIADMSLPDLEPIADMSLPGLELIVDMSWLDLEP
ncbi:hypothetical protein MAR_007567, partial [Mya arenaria]